MEVSFGLSVALLPGMSTTANREAWNRLEARLSAMRAGEVITVDELATDTGIETESAELVLDSLVRAELFERHDQQFVRVSLFGEAEIQGAVDNRRRRQG
jgi:hypothetical protein